MFQTNREKSKDIKGCVPGHRNKRNISCMRKERLSDWTLSAVKLKSSVVWIRLTSPGSQGCGQSVALN